MHDAGYEIGWWIESADEEMYGPVSRATVKGFLRDGVISRNTLVRHCTQDTSRPVADQPGMTDDVVIDEQLPVAGDRLEESWPRSARQRRELAETGLPCSRHRRPAELVCVRCHAPYCHTCRMRPLRKRFYFCRPCQTNHNNRRFIAFTVDGFLVYLIIVPLSIFAQLAGGELWGLVASQLFSWGGTILYVFRDVLLQGASPGKRLVGLRIVRTSDGQTPLGYGQALVRFLPLLIPFFPIIEGVLIYRDPLMRRLGDRWAGTRVIDTPPKLARARAKTEARLNKKDMAPVIKEGITMQQYARLAE